MKTKTLLGTLLALPAVLLPAWAWAQQESANLQDEYLKNLKNYEFINTRGMMDLAPNRHSWMPSDHEDPDTWELPTEAEINRLKELGITFPDFSFITGTDTVADGQKRQRTHTVEHILYALPGDALSLYPYYGLEETVTRYADKTDRYPTKNYLETFSHWYDFRNGGRVLHQGKDGKTYDLLDFPADRDLIQITDNYGFYGGIYMSPGTKELNTGPTIEVATAAGYVEAVNTINNSGGRGAIILTADLDFSELDNIPMLGDRNDAHFSGTLNGNGHKISNLKLEKDFGEVGLIRYAANGATIANLVIDASCTFQGSYVIGLIGKFDGGRLTVRNVTVNATIKGTRGGNDDHCAGAILGLCDGKDSDNRLFFENIYIGATIGDPDMDTKNKKNAVLCGWMEMGNTRATSIFTNIVFRGRLYGDEGIKGAWFIRRVLHEKFHDWGNCKWEGDTYIEQHDDYAIRYTRCYGERDADADEPAWKAISEYTSFDSWKDDVTPPTKDFPTYNAGVTLLGNKNHRPWHEGDDAEKRRRIAGTSAVFYFPGDLGEEWINATDEYVIAADFSQTFEPTTHLDTDDFTVTEPVVAFRHLFRIRDGREQARQLYENNRDYIRQHQHKVSARADANFQIRLDFPLPTNWGQSGGVTNYYYKKADGSFDRVKRFDIRVLNGETRKEEPTNPGFNCGADIRMRRAWASTDKTHAEALNGPSDGKFDYHTMLHIRKSDITADSHYIVQILAKDDEGNILPTSDGGDMVIMEYDITFLPEKGASLLTQDDLYGNDEYSHAREEYMKEHYGEPIDVIDFDAYIKLNKLPDSDPLKKKTVSYSVIEHIDGTNWTHPDFPVYRGKSGFDGSGANKMQHSFYKWPIAWNRSTYSFGYNYRYDYNMYMLATHSENVPYHEKADNWTDNANGENGLYDRLYYKTKRLHDADPRVNLEQGYFYYVNAASDPGVSARLNFSIPCPGSRVVVSAWVAEMSPASKSQDEPANLSFNFVAVMKGTNERITLHNFITGYLGEKSIYDSRELEKPEQLGKWLNVYYSFVPRLAEFYSDVKTFDDVDHFELELAHNGMSSAGSDYAIDDIRAYVVPPYSEAGHKGYACEDSPLDVTIETSFETLLEKSGHAEAFEVETDEKITLYFAFVDKEMADDDGTDLQKAFVNAVMKGDDALPYGTVKFSNNYRKNDRYSDAVAAGEVTKNQGYRSTSESGDRIIKFLTTVGQSTLRIGKEYYVVFHPAISDADSPTEDALASYFELGGECAYTCDMTLQPSLKIKIDGIIQSKFNEIAVCENQSPVIQANVWSTDEDPVEVMKNAYFDWFDGSINDFSNYRFKDYPNSMDILMDDSADSGAMTLSHALEVFRFRYSDAETTVGIRPDATAGEDGETLEQWMLDIIDVASAPDTSGRTRLQLHQASFVLPPVQLPDATFKAQAKVVAIPIIDLYPGESLCSSPTEIGVHVSHRTPLLQHGLTGISYPEHLADVPLRVGLRQLTKGDCSSLLVSKKRLDMPVRKVSSSDGKEKKFSLVEEKTIIGGEETTRKGCLLLAQTNDPEYRDLGTLNGANEETGYLLWVGEIKELKAAAHDGAAPDREYFLADFDDDFKFKEGYYYRMRFRFEEEADENIDADSETVCQGQDIFTIKVVPEHLQWTGDKNLSWDNDENWRRLASSEILKKDAPADNAFFTDGATPNLRAYAPLSFTKVIVEKPTVNEDEVEGENPWLYAPKTSTKVKDEYTASLEHIWSSDPSCSEVSDEMSAVGKPTSLIEYDMTAYVTGTTSDAELRCRPWAANSCAEIHFLPGATVMGQQHLSYDRAWVDVELDHSRWYLLSTPLKDVYAGDFYLPTENARQGTELFQEIRFDESLNDRFAPAVYQRGWDKATASVYEFGKTGARNAAVKTFWSHVYNDVAEKYGEGNAFSVKTDVSKADSPADKVLFRLPKADTEYLYYSADGNQSGHKTKLSKDDSYKLNDTHGTLTSATANAGRYFMVGNPFMTYFDIRKFLEANASKFNQKYWLITEGGMIAGSLSDAGAFVATPTILTDLPADPSVIAPMQGFFVEAKEESESIELTYDESMMRRYDSSNMVLTEPTRASNAILRITSINDGRPASAALLVAGDPDHGASVNTFDFRDLGIPSVVFTARDGHALSINLSSDAEGTEIGVLADDDTETTLIFEGTEHFADLMLFDREENTLTPLPQANGIKVKGTVSGRFFLTSGTEKNIVPDSLRWTIEGDVLTVTDTASTGSLSITVCDIVGRVISHRSTDGDTLSVGLESGIFVVRIANANEEKTIKLSL